MAPPVHRPTLDPDNSTTKTTRYRIVIWNQYQRERLVVRCIDHYNRHRPHRSLDQRPPLASEAPTANQRRLQNRDINPMRRTHQRIPKRSLTSHDAIFGPHTSG
jgi:hypothetical protein